MVEAGGGDGGTDDEEQDGDWAAACVAAVASEGGDSGVLATTDWSVVSEGTSLDFSGCMSVGVILEELPQSRPRKLWVFRRLLWRHPVSGAAMQPVERHELVEFGSIWGTYSSTSIVGCVS